MNYQDAKEYLEHGKDKTRRRISGRATHLVQDGDSIFVEHHGHRTVELQPNGDVVLNSCGWHTTTTKERMNRFLRGWRVSQERSRWYLWNYITHEQMPFADGVIVHADGTVSGAGTPDDDERNKAMVRRIDKYVKGYMKALFAGEVPAPGLGDCWYCSLRPGKVEKIEIGGGIVGQAASEFYDGGTVPMGEAMGRTDHLTSHFGDSGEEGEEEPYYVPSLLNRAIEVFPVSNYAMWVLGGLWGYMEPMEDRGGLAEHQLRASLRRYLRKQLGLAS